MATAPFPMRGSAAPLVIAHRGASAGAPENTMAAFDAAWAAGAPWVETDVQPSADGVPMLLHDDDLDRTTDGHGPIRAARSAALARLDAGSWFDAGAFAGAAIPQLRQLIETLRPGRSVLLEIKGAHTAAQIDAVLAAVVDQPVFVQSFELAALQLVRTAEPHRPVGLLVERLDADPVGICRDLGATAYNPDHTRLRERPEVVGQLHRAGIATTPWTADDPDDWAFLTGLGVDGIITNRPAELLAWQRNTA